MTAEDSSRRRALTVHGAIVGVGWFVVALPALLLIEGNTGVRDWFGELAPSVQGMIGSVVVLCAIPLLWPVYLAIGWYETQAAQHVDETRGSLGPHRLLLIQAGLMAAATIGVVMLAVVYRGVEGGDYLALSWLPLASIAGAHLWTARPHLSGSALHAGGRLRLRDRRSTMAEAEVIPSIEVGASAP